MAVKAFLPLLRDFQIADILYRDYRSRSIHEFDFNVDDRFFTESGVYLAARYHPWATTRFLELCLSARWIIDVYQTTVQNYERTLLSRKKLPLGRWSLLCDISTELHALDDASVIVGRDLKIRVEK